MNSAPSSPHFSPLAEPLDVLIAEDDVASRKGLEREMLHLGHRCRAACDGKEAWDMQQERRADVVVSDYRMPRLDGAELCRNVRLADGDDTYTYFILLTAFADRAHLLRGMEAGADDYEEKPVDLDKIEGQLLTAGRVVDHYRRLAAASSKLHDPRATPAVPRIDIVTGLPNTVRLTDELEIFFSNAKRYNRHCCIAICSVDLYKPYAAELGQEAADRALEQIARTLRGSIRKSDAIYRLDGEELLLVLTEQALYDASRVMTRMRQAIERIRLRAPGRQPLTLSIGLAQLERFDESTEQWLHRVNRALGQAKMSGRNCVVIDA
jgi:diguanylate cyclase (GGDEF)-like protein